MRATGHYKSRPGTAPTRSRLRVAAKCTHPPGIERPVQFGTTGRIAQHRHAQAVAGLQRRILINEHGLKFGRACLCQHIQCQLAQMAIVTLKQGQGHHWKSAAGA